MFECTHVEVERIHEWLNADVEAAKLSIVQWIESAAALLVDRSSRTKADKRSVAVV